MPFLQVAEASLTQAGPLLHVAELSLDTAAPSGDPPSLHIAEASLSVTGGAPSITGSSVTAGGAPVTLAKAGVTVTLTVTIEGSYDTVDWTLQPTSAAVSLAVQSATVRTFTAPFLPDREDVLVAVTASGPGGTSDPVFLSVGVQPHTDWYLEAGEWHPAGGSDTIDL